MDGVGVARCRGIQGTRRGPKATIHNSAIRTPQSAIDRPFILQWHLTARCSFRCAHCYMRDEPTYESELKNELPPEECMRVLDDFCDSLRRWGEMRGRPVPGRINFTGGDPLARRDLLELVEAASSRGLFVGILGTPDRLTPGMARNLREAGVRRYQVSIDGLEATHDRLRGRPGAFRAALRAIRILRRAGIPSVVMFTLSRENAADLIPVIGLAAREGAAVFDFARLVPLGAGRRMSSSLLRPHEYRDLMLRVLEEYRRLSSAGSITHFGRKESLWSALYGELGFLRPALHHPQSKIRNPKSKIQNPKSKIHAVGGCSAGSTLLTVLADGTVVPCRRMPVPVGRVPGKSLYDILLGVKCAEFRRVGALTACRRCRYLRLCRGCPAVPHALTGDWRARDPQCWVATVK